MFSGLRPSSKPKRTWAYDLDCKATRLSLSRLSYALRRVKGSDCGQRRYLIWILQMTWVPTYPRGFRNFWHWRGDALHSPKKGSKALKGSNAKAKKLHFVQNQAKPRIIFYPLFLASYRCLCDFIRKMGVTAARGLVPSGCRDPRTWQSQNKRTQRILTVVIQSPVG